MRYAIFSDIHGNLEALRAVIEACRLEGARSYYCIGDIVGYGANPKECIDLVRELEAECVAGNHDWAVTGKIAIKNFNPQAQAAVEWTKKQLPKKYLEFLNTRELLFKNNDFIMVHGTLNKPEKFMYLTDIPQALDTFFLMDRAVCLVGHTHAAEVYIKTRQAVRYAETPQVNIFEQNKYIVNVGSVGQPRDGDPYATYCIFDPDLKRIEVKRVAYDVETAQRKIIEAGLPEFLAKRLSIGQ